MELYEKEFLIITSLNTDPVIPWLSGFYAGTGQGSPRDPLCMMRSFLLMILMRGNDMKQWVRRTRESPFIAVLCGFNPGDTPGTGTYYDSEDRIIRGPYRPGITAEIRSSGPKGR